ncbi:MAG: hypothetical protein M0Z77_02145 [Thermoplasmatales archaeon]|nr:hypothetical protein [Candidatus Thermoplasmatota archaeon]MDA8054438.1 hypothetical protein [Thermoplasmatales archaeon]
MSDNFKVLGVGGAGVNVVKALGYRNSVFIDSYGFDNLEGVEAFVKAQGKGERVIVVSSPAGEFSSSVLKSVCRILNSNGNSVFLIGILPFHSESPERKKRGDVVLRDLRKNVENTAIVENENFASSMKEYSWTQVLSRINEHVDNLIKGFVAQGTEEMTHREKVSDPENSLGFTPNVSIGLN